MKKYVHLSYLTAGLILTSVYAQAQLFSTPQPAETQPTAAAPNAEKKEKDAQAVEDIDLDLEDMTPEERRQTMDRLAKKYQPRIVDGNLVMNNVELPKTKDGSQRGSSTFIELSKDGKNRDKESHIFIYYSNFSMTRNRATGVGCRMRFNVLTDMDQRLMNLSVKLVWPNISTNVSFNNVNPNIENYFDYALFGQGCYSMDKIPNIVVNRCRAKGMSQEACAAKIRWLSKK